jgi:F-type H+-transporting ATPase subunit delta
MPRRETAARRYAEAAFEFGRADGTLERWEADLDSLRELLRDRELRAVLEHPAIAYARKEAVLRRVARGVSDQPLNLVLLMVRRGRPGAIDRMVEHFGTLLRRHRGVELAEVRSALPLEADQRRAVVARLGELTGSEIEINEVVDGSLIGGIAVRIGDQLYDASVRGRLERLRARLTAAS